MNELEETAREDALRELERVMMYIAEAQRKAEDVGDALARGEADSKFVTALKTAASALRAEHNRLLNSTHFDIPETPIPSLEAEEEREAAEQQRMAI